jgi:serine/threonine protein kinase
MMPNCLLVCILLYCCLVFAQKSTPTPEPQEPRLQITLLFSIAVIIIATLPVYIGFLVLYIYKRCKQRKKYNQLQEDQNKVNNIELITTSKLYNNITLDELNIIQEIDQDICIANYYDIKVTVEKLPKNTIKILNNKTMLMSELNHINVSTYVGTIIYENFCYVITEYFSNGSLLNVIRSQPDKLKPFNNVIKILISICDALVYLHANDIVHGNLKSSNVMITEDWIVKVSDFGCKNTNVRKDALNFAIIMWESFYIKEHIDNEPIPIITSNDEHNFTLFTELHTGKTTELIISTVQSYFSIMYKCVNEEITFSAIKDSLIQLL